MIHWNSLPNSIERCSFCFEVQESVCNQPHYLPQAAVDGTSLTIVPCPGRNPFGVMDAVSPLWLSSLWLFWDIVHKRIHIFHFIVVYLLEDITSPYCSKSGAVCCEDFQKNETSTQNTRFASGRQKSPLQPKRQISLKRQKKNTMRKLQVYECRSSSAHLCVLYDFFRWF